MIKYNLKCLNNHEFESWFSDSGEFEKIKKKSIIGMHLLFFKENKQIYHGPSSFSC